MDQTAKVTTAAWFAAVIISAMPGPPVPIVEWGETNVRLPGSARSERFDSSITPWTREPLEACFQSETRKVTFVKPVQSGGSVVGEVTLCRVVASGAGGDIQYNWADNDKARDRWVKRIERILQACPAVMARAPTERHKWNRGLVNFPHTNLTVQGAFEAKNLDSDSIRVQINEEIHAWEPGRLIKAYRRSTAYWNSLTLNISNAGIKDDQLHKAFEEGTQQHWEVRCPDCGKFHVMQTRWNERKPENGGLRYDADVKGCRLTDGRYDYNKLLPTIFYQMPCGYRVRDNPKERRELSLSGRYGKPQNQGAQRDNLSFTLDGVAVDYIPWVTLIEEKHNALRALRGGDPKPWETYIKERECRFYDPESRPVMGKVILSTKHKKDREGMADRAYRFCAVDYQRGTLEAGELPYWWMVIRDVDENGNSLLVYEGKLETEADVVDTVNRHDVIPANVVVDSGYAATQVYRFCLTHGFNAIKGGKQDLYSHGEEGRKIFSPEKPLHEMLNRPPSRENPIEEPQFWFYSKPGIRDTLNGIRSPDSTLEWVVPSDVSDDYQAHMESEELQEQVQTDGSRRMVWVQLKARNDLFVCECYIAMQMNMLGLVGEKK